MSEDGDSVPVTPESTPAEPVESDPVTSDPLTDPLPSDPLTRVDPLTSEPGTAEPVRQTDLPRPLAEAKAAAEEERLAAEAHAASLDPAEVARAAWARGEGVPEEPPEPRRRMPSVSVSLDWIREKLASLVWLVAVLASLVLADGALCVALKMNLDNGIISALLDAAHKLDFNEVKKFKGSDVPESSAAIKWALVNWGIAAVIWLIVGKILDKLIRP